MTQKPANDIETSYVDYQQPSYAPVFSDRAKKLTQLRKDTKLLHACKLHYRTHPWDFVSDWGMTFDPRNIERNILPAVPFILWAKQKEYLEWLYSRWKGGNRGLVEKSRDCGVTWLSVGFAASMWCFEPGFSVGFGSRKEDLVDRKGDFDSIFEKVRFFIDNIPIEFLPPSYNERQHAAHMRIVNPDTGASITGEAGDNIGRGGRKSVYIVDEAAFLEQQKKVDAALSQNTNCQIDISTPNGNGNEFYKKRMRFDNTESIFIFDWKDDPRKDDAWYQKQCEEQDEVTVAQEIDRDYNASAEDSFINAKWVKSAIDAHKVLGFEASGIRVTGFDPADVGDAKACVNRHGSIIREATQLKKGDITHAMPWAFHIADNFRADILSYDADGMGAPTMKLTLTSMAPRGMDVLAYHGSAGVTNPTNKPGEEKISKRIKMKNRLDRVTELHGGSIKTNADTYENYRAQTWSGIRDRFELTHEAVERAKSGQLVNVRPEDLISIDSNCECLQQLVAELSRPKRIFTNNGKIKVESKKEMKARSVDSPNLADSAVIAFAATKPPEKKPMPKFEQYRPYDQGIGV